MLKLLIIGLLFFSFLNAEDGLVDPDFYKEYIEIEGHYYRIILIQHLENCPCQSMPQ